MCINICTKSRLYVGPWHSANVYEDTKTNIYLNGIYGTISHPGIDGYHFTPCDGWHHYTPGIMVLCHTLGLCYHSTPWDCSTISYTGIVVLFYTLGLRYYFTPWDYGTISHTGIMVLFHTLELWYYISHIGDMVLYFTHWGYGTTFQSQGVKYSTIIPVCEIVP
jgi:hypothetical protein